MPAAPSKKFDLISKTVILSGHGQNKGVDAIPAPNPNQMHRVIGLLPDGRKVVVAKRPGKGGMDFTKLMGGKVFAVAADAFSPVYEKEDGKPTKKQKQEDGLPLFSSSGFYSLSSREYPALDMFECYARLFDRGEMALLITDEALQAPQSMVLMGEDSLSEFLRAVGENLDDAHNLVRRHDAAINRKRERAITRARQDAEDEAENNGGAPYSGVEFKPAEVSKKDGNAFCLCVWKSDSGASGSFYVLRQKKGLTENNLQTTIYLTAEEAVAHLSEASPRYAALRRELAAGCMVQAAIVRGHVMRSSVSFRKKVENALALPDDKPKYGDAPFVLGALHGWCRALVVVMHSQHPGFPQSDYDSHHYVAALRQAEIGMNKKPDGSGWLPPEPVTYALEAHVLSALV
jgi:hypothetical protein